MSDNTDLDRLLRTAHVDDEESLDALARELERRGYPRKPTPAPTFTINNYGVRIPEGTARMIAEAARQREASARLGTTWQRIELVNTRPPLEEQLLSLSHHLHDD